MTKTIRFDEIEGIFNFLSTEWDSLSANIRLSNKSLYNLITLKKAFESKHYTIQETVIAIMRKHGAKETDNGGLKVPDENIPAANKELMDLQSQTDEIESPDIEIRDEDVIPARLMEIIYDFVTLK